jgi:hypothetical protein
VPQLIGHTGINYAMRHLDPTRVATATLLEPVGAGLLAFLVFAEVPTPSPDRRRGAPGRRLLTVRTGRDRGPIRVPGTLPNPSVC